MKTIFIVTGVLILIFIIKAFMRTGKKSESDTDRIRLPNENSSKPERQNDKLVLVDNLSKKEMESILTSFCKIYNQENYKAQPRLFVLSERKFAITFPFDIDFKIYCFFVNYVRYPMGFDKQVDVIVWTSTKQAKGWITEKTENKKVMLFIPEDDREYDNVFLTTNDNIGYKLGFATGEEKQLLPLPKKGYFAPTTEINSLTEKQSEDFQ